MGNTGCLLLGTNFMSSQNVIKHWAKSDPYVNLCMRHISVYLKYKVGFNITEKELEDRVQYIMCNQRVEI